MTDRAGEYIVGLFGAEDELLATLREEADRTGLPPNEYLAVLTCIVLSGVIACAVWRTRWPITEYLALIMPLKLHIAVAIIGAIGIGLGEGIFLSWLGGSDANDKAIFAGYLAAQRAGLLPLYWLNTVAFAPLTEEVMFRGFLLPS